jgi:putative phosphoribosyl transferase
VTLFRDRGDAGRALARRLSSYAGRSDVTILALPRGGVPVASEISRALGLPLDVFLVRKLGVPGHEELAMGAIASGGARVLDSEVLRAYRVSEDELERVAAAERRELDRRQIAYRRDRPALDVRGRTVILVDDGLATGSSMRAAVEALGPLSPARVVVAVPVAPRSTVLSLERVTDEVVCLEMPEPFLAVGMFYENFEQTSDEEVRDLLSLPLSSRRAS